MPDRRGESAHGRLAIRTHEERVARHGHPSRVRTKIKAWRISASGEFIGSSRSVPQPIAGSSAAALLFIAASRIEYGAESRVLFLRL